MKPTISGRKRTLSAASRHDDDGELVTAAAANGHGAQVLTDRDDFQRRGLALRAVERVVPVRGDYACGHNKKGLQRFRATQASNCFSGSGERRRSYAYEIAAVEIHGPSPLHHDPTRFGGALRLRRVLSRAGESSKLVNGKSRSIGETAERPLDENVVAVIDDNLIGRSTVGRCDGASLRSDVPHQRQVEAIVRHVTITIKQTANVVFGRSQSLLAECLRIQSRLKRLRAEQFWWSP
jgi:hypothetical protein